MFRKEQDSEVASASSASSSAATASFDCVHCFKLSINQNSSVCMCVYGSPVCHSIALPEPAVQSSADVVRAV